MKFSILTPSYQQPELLRVCARSVRAQCKQTVGTPPLTHVHHHIQNGGDASDMEALVSLQEEVEEFPLYQLSIKSETDGGMYDALNRAYAATEEEIIGHINSDEQYLPGCLETVATLFRNDAALDVVFGAVIVVDPRGRYLCSRIPLLPREWHTRVCHLSVFTGAMFVRRRAIEQLGFYFDSRFRTAGDADLICRMLAAGLRMTVTTQYLSLFTDSGENLALSPEAKAERERMRKSAPALVRQGSSLLSLHHRLRKGVAGAYRLKPFSYPFLSPPDGMEHFQVDHPRGRWPKREKR